MKIIKNRLLYIVGFFLFLSNFLSSAIQITLTADPNIACIGCSISFSVSSPCNLTGATFYWNFGDGNSDVTSVPFTSHIYNSPGDYTASVLVVKSNDSGSASTSVSIKQLGNFIIDAQRIFDIPENPMQFHIHAFQILLTDTNGNSWNPSASRCMHVLYEWWNCWDQEYFSSGHVPEYTFSSIFTFTYPEATGVRAIVYCECNPRCNLLSDVVTIYLSRKVQ